MDGRFSEVLLEMSCMVIGLRIEIDMQIQFSFYYHDLHFIDTSSQTFLKKIGTISHC